MATEADKPSVDGLMKLVEANRYASPQVGYGEIRAYAERLLGGAPPDSNSGVPQLWLHKKSGGVYRWLMSAVREDSNGVVVVVYQSEETGVRWVRPSTEFYDGRFERIAAAPSPLVAPLLVLPELKQPDSLKANLTAQERGDLQTALPEGTLDAENQWLGDMMILQALADSEHVNEQEREVLARWMESSSRPPGESADARPSNKKAPESSSASPVEAVEVLTEGELWALIHKDFPHANERWEKAFTFGEVKVIVDRARKLVAQPPQAVQEVRHVCGLQGFGQSLDDQCLACRAAATTEPKQ